MKRVYRKWKFLAIAVIVNVLIIFLLRRWLGTESPDHEIRSEKIVREKEEVEVPDSTLTIVFQDFDLMENAVSESVMHIARDFTFVDVIVIAETLPYPPIKLTKLPNVKLVLLKNRLKNVLNDSRPEVHIKTKFVLFLPDGVIIDVGFIDKFKSFVRHLDGVNSNKAHAFPVGHAQLKCQGVDFSVRTWTLEVGGSMPSDNCDYISGAHGLLMKTSQLYRLSHPFLPPTFLSLYIQMSILHIKVAIKQDLYLTQSRKLHVDATSQWHHKHAHSKKVKRLFRELGIKRVLRENGRVDWYGCGKETDRCFSTVHEDMPEYLYHGRWTPPCCLKALRETAHHVFSILDECRVRYWLEGGSLLGAVRENDIIPWDYDIDIGIYQEDIIKCTQLVKVMEKAFVDEKDYSWEKAIEGDFYRVQYSESNHMHVDIFPFVSKNGVMTKDTWLKTHRQDTEFPEKFLKPLTRIKFAGLDASAPNHIREFLEYKFGKGVIESPKYPNAETVI